MARRTLNRFSDRAATTARTALRYDGGGLYLASDAPQREGQFRRSWLFLYATGDIATNKTGKPR